MVITKLTRNSLSFLALLFFLLCSISPAGRDTDRQVLYAVVVGLVHVGKWAELHRRTSHAHFIAHAQTISTLPTRYYALCRDMDKELPPSELGTKE